MGDKSDVKIITVGDPAVGKSSLLLRFCDGTFTDTPIITLGDQDFKTRTIKLNKKDTVIQIWDTAGQERFKTITSSYYRCAHAVLFVADITQAETIESLASWVTEVERWACGAVVKLIALNKCDSEGDERAINEDELKELSAKWKDDWGVVAVLETSAKEGTNVDEVFTQLAKAVAANQNQDGGGDGGDSGGDDDEGGKKRRACCLY